MPELRVLHPSWASLLEAPSLLLLPQGSFQANHALAEWSGRRSLRFFTDEEERVLYVERCEPGPQTVSLATLVFYHFELADLLTGRYWGSPELVFERDPEDLNRLRVELQEGVSPFPVLDAFPFSLSMGDAVDAAGDAVSEFTPAGSGL